MTPKKQQVSVRPLGDRILVREDVRKDTETTTKFGLIIPATASTDKSTKRGIVVAVGPGRYDNGKIIPVSVQKGDAVLFSWGDTIMVDDVEYVLVRENEVIAVIE